MFIEAELNDIIEASEYVNVYNDGKKLTYAQGDATYNLIAEGWKSMTRNSREMPAYGVSLNGETVKALTNGVWVEFVFGVLQTHNEMPFEKLLVNVEKKWQGFNIIRYMPGTGYDGRCFYYDLIGEDMSDFYDILVNL